MVDKCEKNKEKGIENSVGAKIIIENNLICKDDQALKV